MISDKTKETDLLVRPTFHERYDLRLSSNVLHSRSLFLKSDTGGLVHHYSHPSAQIDGNYTLENLYGQFDGNYMFFKRWFHPPEKQKPDSNIWLRPGRRRIRQRRRR